MDVGLHDTYNVVARFHVVPFLGAILAIFSGIFFNGENIVGTNNLLLSSSCTISLSLSLFMIYNCDLIFIAILLTFFPNAFLRANVMPIHSGFFSFLELPVIYWIRNSFPILFFSHYLSLLFSILYFSRVQPPRRHRP